MTETHIIKSGLLNMIKELRFKEFLKTAPLNGSTFPKLKLKDLYISLLKSIRMLNLYERLQLLEDKNLYIEYILISSQIVEHLLKNIINAISQIFNTFTLASGQLKSVNTMTDKDNLTLGELIRTVEKYLKNQSLINKLKDFNNLRKLAAHKLLENKLEISEKIIKGYLSKNSIPEIIRLLQKQEMQLSIENMVLGIYYSKYQKKMIRDIKKYQNHILKKISDKYPS